MNKKLILLLLLGAMSTTLMAQRHTDKLDRGLVAVPTNSGNFVSWRRLTNEYYDVTYNLYRGSVKVASDLTKTSYRDKGGNSSSTYQIEPVLSGKPGEKCDAVSLWKSYYYKYAYDTYNGYIDIALSPVYDRDGNVVTEHYEPNDAEMADLDGDGQLELIVKRLNTVDASAVYPESSKEFVVLDAYDINWQTGAATLMWRIDCGPNMVSLNSTEVNIIAYDWDEDGEAEVVLRGADNMIVYGSDGKTHLFTIGDMSVNTRNTFNPANGSQYAWTHTGAEYLIYMNGHTGEKYDIMNYPLKRLDYYSTLSAEWGGRGYGHNSSKYFFGAPFLDGRKASLFLARGIYGTHKMIAMDLNVESHKWEERWRWMCNKSSSPWYGNGYHNFIIADVDEDGRDEIVYGSMVIDDNGKGLSTSGYGHGDAQHVSDFNPYRKGLEFFGCLEDQPYWGSDYRDATTGEILHKRTQPIEKDSNGNIIDKDDGRALCANLTDDYPGCFAQSVSSGVINTITNEVMPIGAKDSYLLNFRIYWDGDLCSETLTSKSKSGWAMIDDFNNGRLFTSDGNVHLNNDSKNNACFVGDIIGDWREEMVLTNGSNIRIYTTTINTEHSLPTLWNDHQYRQAMVWQMMAYNQPPHLSYFLGKMEGITVAPPTLTNDGRTEVANGETISTTTDHLLMCETNDMTVTVEEGAAPYILTVNTPSWVQGTDVNGTSGTKVKSDGNIGATNLPAIETTIYTHTLKGGAFTGGMRLVKQGDGMLVLPDVEETYTGETNVWAGTLRFNGTMKSSPVWLNRHTTLETDGGKFTKSITADYGSIIVVGSEGITVGTLTLNHGARLKVSIDGDGTVTLVNATKIVLKKKSDDIWEQYGPQYLKPVVEFTLGGSLNNGKYVIGEVGSVTGDVEQDIVLEGLDGVATPRLAVEDGKLLLIVGTGESIDCPEATFTVTRYHSTADGLLPIVSINPGTFSLGVPTMTAIFNDSKVDLLTLYSEDYENATDASAWTTKYATVELAAEKHINIIQGGGSGPRSAYTKFYANSFYGDCNSYAIEFDAYFHYAHGNFGPNELVIYGEGARMPSSNALFSNPNYLFKMTGGSNYSTGYSVEGSSTPFSLNDYQWYHYVIHVDKSSRKVDYIITSDGGTVSSGSYDVTDNSINLNAQGFEVGLGRAYSQAGLDNIRIYHTDGYYYTFEEPGTLTVTTSYPGCQSATATYEVTEALKPGDVNKDGKVNIVDVAVTISYMTGQEPQNFVKAAADIDCNGTVGKIDLDEIVRRIGW